MITHSPYLTRPLAVLCSLAAIVPAQRASAQPSASFPVGEAVVADRAERGYSGRLGSVRAADCYVPLGPASSTVLISEEEIAQAATRLLAR